MGFLLAAVPAFAGSSPPGLQAADFRPAAAPPPSEITVDTLADLAADDGVCSLREAITAADMDIGSGASAGECAAGSGADSIGFSVEGTITLDSKLPPITADLTIDGGGKLTLTWFDPSAGGGFGPAILQVDDGD